MFRCTFSIILSLLGALTGFEAQLNAAAPVQAAQAPAASSPAGHNSASLSVDVISGRNGTNILKPASAVQPVLEVRDANNRPVIGAIVTFSSPMDEPTVRFPNGNRNYSMVSDESGRVAVENMVPLGVGKFQVDVAVSYGDSHADAVIPQTNYPTLKAASAPGNLSMGSRVAAPESGGLSRGAKIGIVAGIVAVGAGVGIYFATRGHSTNSNSSISVGTVTVGAPH
ncbi:MAG: hypothetical protein JO051_09535 [Acidobacteriaceae bacterium]|nr:hypothetical protein [Acidobacteriaceae bacterium]